MKMPKVVKAASMAVLLLTAAQITFAQSSDDTATKNIRPNQGDTPGAMGGKGHRANHEEMKKRFAEELNLTKAQQAQIEAIHQASYNAHQGEREAHRAQFEAVRRMKESGASQEEIQAKLQALPKPDFAAMHAERAKVDAKIMALLNPDQVKKFAALKSRHMPPPPGPHRGHGNDFPPPHES